MWSSSKDLRDARQARGVGRQPNTIYVGHVTFFMGQNMHLGPHHHGSTQKSEIKFRNWTTALPPTVPLHNSWHFTSVNNIATGKSLPYLAECSRHSPECYTLSTTQGTHTEWAPCQFLSIKAISMCHYGFRIEYNFDVHHSQLWSWFQKPSCHAWGDPAWPKHLMPGLSLRECKSCWVFQQMHDSHWITILSFQSVTSDTSS